MNCRIEGANTDNAQVYTKAGVPSKFYASLLQSMRTADVAVPMYFRSEQPDFAQAFPSPQLDENQEPVLTPDMLRWLSDRQKTMPETEDLKLAKVTTYTEIKERLKKVLLIGERRYANVRDLDRSDKAREYVKKLELIRASLEATDSFDGGLRLFIQDAHVKLLETRRYVDSLKIDMAKNAANPAYFTPEKINEILTKLSSIKSFASSFIILKDMHAKLLATDGADISGFEDIKTQLAEAIGLEEYVFNEYKQLALDSLVKWMWPTLDRRNRKLEAAGDGKFKVTQEKLKEWFDAAPKEIGFFNNFLGATVASDNALNSLILVMVKDKIFDSQKEDMETMADVLDEFQKVSGPKNNTAALNQKYMRDILIWEKVPVKKDGKILLTDTGEPVTEWVQSKRKAIHQPYMWDKLADEHHKFQETYGRRPTDPLGSKIWVKKYMEFWAKNYRMRSNPEEFLKEKLKSFTGTQEEKLTKLRKWVMANSDGVRTFTNRQFAQLDEYEQGMYSHNPAVSIPWLEVNPGEGFVFRPGLSSAFRIPAPQYKNPAWESLSKDPYFKTLFKAYTEANMKYPDGKRLRYGEVPQLRKSGWDAVSSAESIGSYINRIKSDVSLAAQNRESVDIQYGGETLQDITGEKYHFLPTPYTSRLPYEEVSDDLLHSILKFSQAANKYDNLSDIQPHIETLSSIIFGVKDIAKLAGRKLYPTIKGEYKAAIRMNEQLRNGLETAYWGIETDKMEDITIPLMGKEVTVSPNKILGHLGLLTAANKMILNVLSGVNNILLGEYAAFLEALAGQHGDKTTWIKAQAYYVQHLPQLLADIGKGTDKSYISMLFDYFDVMQGEFKDNFGKRVSGSRMKHLWSTDTLFFTNNSAEHKIQGTAAIMKLMYTKVKTISGKEIPLIEAYEKVGNRLRLKKDVLFTKEQEKEFIHELNSMNRDTNGNYAKLDKAALQRRSYGELALMFRKYVYSGFKYRYGEERLDMESGTVKEGFYRTFLKRVLQDLNDKKFTMLTDWTSLSERERANLVRALAEMSIWIGSMLAFIALDDDDDEKSNLQVHALLQLRRFNADLSFFNPVGILANPKDFGRVISTPTVAYGFLTNITDAVQYTIYDMVGSDKAYYKRDSGANEAGDSKALAKWKKVFPVLPQIEHMQDPNDIYNYYKNN